MVLVLQRIEEALAIRRPDAAAAGVGDPVRQFVAAAEVAHAQREELGPLVVECPQELAVVGRMVDAAKAEIGLALCLGVTVEQDLVLAAIARRAEVARLLAAQPE